MLLIIGIGNIGTQYENTRHNAGFIYADEIIKELDADYIGEKFSSECYQVSINDEKIFILKPNTYVNLTGQAALKWMSFFKRKATDILVMYDDADINISKIKYRFASGNGGHNGLRSMDSDVGKNYHKLRIGISSEERGKNKLSNFVLNKFKDEELDLIKQQGKQFAGLMKKLLNKETPTFLKGVNQFKVHNGNFSFDALKAIMPFFEKETLKKLTF